MEDYSDTEEVARYPVLLAGTFYVGDLWGNEARGVAPRENQTLGDFLCESKVSYHAVVVITPEEEVFRFDVPVHDVVLMEGFESFEQTCHDCPHLM